VAKRKPQAPPERPVFDSALLTAWTAELPETLWGECNFRHDIGPADALMCLHEMCTEHEGDLSLARYRLLQMFDRRLVQADDYERLIREALHKACSKEEA
jgi:hypothetical protein